MTMTYLRTEFELFKSSDFSGVKFWPYPFNLPMGINTV